MLELLSFHVVGLSHRSAGVEVRERLSLPAGAAAAFLERERAAGRAALVLSTCNRCEIYWVGDHDHEPWLRGFAEARGVDPAMLTRRDGFAAVRHLFRVAAGLESQILGEAEILSQVRRAWDLTRAAGASDSELDAVCAAALAAGRRARHETRLGDHPHSVSGAAVRLAESAWGGAIGARPVVVLGAGEAAEGVLQALDRAGATRVTLVNRDRSRGEALAAALGGRLTVAVRPWDERVAAVGAADLVVAATAAPEPVLEAADLAGVMAARSGRALLAVDLCVPRNIDPAAAALPGLLLLDLDALRGRCCPVTGESDGAAAAVALADAERLLADELARLDVTLRGRRAAPRLAELHRLGAQVADEEASRALAQLASLGEADRAVIRALAERVVRRVMYPVSRAMRAGAE